MHFKRQLFFTLTLSLLCSSALATDLFGFLLPQCRFEKGVPVAQSEGQLTILTHDGKLSTFAIDEIAGIGHYVLDQSAFNLSHISPEATALAKKFEIKDEKISLRGFAYQFLDGTIFILDHHGSRRVLGADEIGRVETIHDWKDDHKKFVRKLPPLALPSGISECDGEKNGLPPVRFMADKIQVLELINDWEKGFQDLNDLAERSQFYPRPFLFDRHDRFGFIMFNGGPTTNEIFPVRYSFTNGDDFRFQGQTSFGGGFDTIGPRATPLTLLTTDLKFHFLHASFEGNTPAMGIGSTFYNKDSNYIKQTEDKKSSALGDVSFNHIALIGADWKGFGLSAGPIFPIFFVQAGPESRDITPQKSIPLVRLMWTGEKIKLKLSGASGSFQAHNSTQKKSIVMSGQADQDTHTDMYKTNFKFARAGVDWDAAEETKISSDLIFKQWDYKDQVQSQNLSFKSREVSLLSAITRSFSRYVSLGLYILYSSPDHKGTANGKTYSAHSPYMSYGGTFEFLF